MSRVLPILFNTEMVRAILDGRKTVTRRVVKGFTPDNTVFGYTAFTPKGHISCRGDFSVRYGEKFFKMPCQKGNILYVRETWNFVYDTDDCDHIIEDTGRYVYYADGDMPFDNWINEDGSYRDKMPWRPSIHMPKEAARIWLKVTEVRVERLQSMVLDDFLAEGIVIRPEAFNDPENAYQQAKEKFMNIWDSTVKKSDREMYGWDANPWVWTIKFERCEKPENK